MSDDGIKAVIGMILAAMVIAIAFLYDIHVIN